jgi:hypothetical protein
MESPFLNRAEGGFFTGFLQEFSLWIFISQTRGRASLVGQGASFVVVVPGGDGIKGEY